MSIAISLLAAIIAFQDEEADHGVEKPQTGQAAEYFDDIVFGRPIATAGDKGEKVRAALVERIATIDMICRLKSDQKQKLDLAGRGDIKRLFDRLDDQRAEVAGVGDVEFQQQQAAIYRKAAAAQVAFNSDLFREGSLFHKTLDGCLTADQAARWAPFRRVDFFGKMVEFKSTPGGGKQIVAVRLNGAPVVDSDLVGLKSQKGLRRLSLESTDVTDRGLMNVVPLENLEELDLSKIKIDGTGLSELKALRRLKSLSLRNTQLSDAGWAALGKLDQLTTLRVGGATLTDERNRPAQRPQERRYRVCPINRRFLDGAFLIL